MMSNERVHLYHRIPDDMRGEVLHPLNALEKIHPDVYLREQAKYDGREGLRAMKVPGTDWLWNDVLHFSPVHPREVHSALRESGFTPFDVAAFEIDPNEHGFTAENTRIYFDVIGGEGYSEPFDSEKIKGLSSIPEETKRYYAEMSARGERPFLYAGVPHILHKGSIDIRKVKRVTS